MHNVQKNATMKLRFLWIMAFSLTASLVFAQSNLLLDFNENRIKKQKRAMLVLGSWAVANMAAGAALQGNAEGTTKYFHQMNLGWNAINLTIAGLGYWGITRTDPSLFDLAQSIDGSHRFQKILLFNTGLDIGYMIGGAYLIERSKNTPIDKNPDRLKGFGQSIILQGGFLFAFDLATFLILSADNQAIPGLLGNLNFGIQPNGIGLSFKF